MTTSSLTSPPSVEPTARATPGAEPVRRKPRQRVKVVHFVWINQEKFSAPLGIPVFYLCGFSKPRAKASGGLRQVEVVGGVMAITETRDCKHCVRVLERTLGDPAGVAR